MARVIFTSPHGNHKYCGPAALSAITGLSTDTIASLLGDLRWTEGEVTTIKPHELTQAAYRLGIHLEEWLNWMKGADISQPPRLRDLNEDWIVPGTYIGWLEDPGEACSHIVALQMDDHPTMPVVHVVDNMTRSPTGVSSFPYADHRVLICWRVKSQ